MGELQDELEAAIKERDWRALKGFCVGFIVGALFSLDLLLGIFIGIVLAFVVGAASSGKVRKLKQVKEMRRD